VRSRAANHDEAPVVDADPYRPYEVIGRPRGPRFGGASTKRSRVVCIAVVSAWLLSVTSPGRDVDGGPEHRGDDLRPLTARGQAGLEGLKDVSRAEVSFWEKRAVVTFDPAPVSVDQLIDAVNRIGFKASRRPSAG
jgi:copper chaperone CopZ